MCLNSSEMRPEHITMTIALIAKNQAGRDMVLPFIIHNLSEFLKSIDAREIPYMLGSISSYMTSYEQLLQITPLLAYEEEAIVLAAQKMKTKVTNNIQFIRDNYPYVKTWLRQSGYTNYL
ncbi:uncharacterized protein LOC121381781 [Gigantopelta aegis]|uniref:uncharacterized protein LOC121381781 n=1 Tax=Gigantopelta aegis TaxID=1735272 RepID=UPI001B888347|nr:uncharacterized protein LOC121381781 [Gigantopelta aegis]